MFQNIEHLQSLP